MAKDRNGRELPKGIRQRANGKYEGRVKYEYQSYSVYGNTVTDCKKAMLDLRYQLEHGLYVEKSKMTIDEWFATWIEEYKSLQVKKSTVKQYESYYGRYIRPVIGKKPVTSLRPEHIQKLLNDLARNGYSNSTVQLTKDIIYGLLQQAFKNGIIEINPVLKVSIPKGRMGTEKKPLTEEEQRLFLNYATGSDVENIFRFALMTGMRNGELCGLRRCDIDFENRLIHVNHTLVYIPGEGLQLDEPKSKAGKRDIPMLDCAYDLLKEQMRMQDSLSNGNISYLKDERYVFSYDGIEPMRMRHVDNELKKIQKRMREDGIVIEGFSMHTLRHTFATRCLEQGMQFKTLQVIMGHATMQMTADLYSHVLPNMKLKEMQKIAILF